MVTSPRLLSSAPRSNGAVSEAFPTSPTDGHYGRPEVMEWCDENDIDFVFGLPGNTVLDRLVDATADDIRTRRALDQKPACAIGAGFAGLLTLLPLPMAIDIRTFALVGMGAMVGGGTGAVMTAAAMIFEMTRDYDIVLPMIIAFAVGVRRILSRENIYTLQLYRRGHVVPKALHARYSQIKPPC